MSSAKFKNQATPPTPPTGETTIFVGTDKCAKQVDDAGLVTDLCNDAINSFETHATPLGTSPVADSSTDTLTYTSSDSSIDITGTAASDTIDLKVNTGNNDQNLFETVVTDTGGPLVADSATDTLTITSSDTSISVAGAAGSDTVDLTATPSSIGVEAFKTFDTPLGTDVVADTATDTLTMTSTGGTIDITGTAASDTINFDIAASITDPLVVQAQKTSTHTHSTSGFTSITLDQTDIESDASRLSHAGGATITSLEPGTKTFLCTYYTDASVTNDTVSENADLVARVVLNGGASAIAGSEGIHADHFSFSSNFSEDMHITKAFYVELANTDTVELQTEITLTAGAGITTQGTIKPSTLTLELVEGKVGPTGATGAGADIIVQKDDVTVGTVTDTLNFEGSVTVVDEGSNKTTVTILGSDFGTEYELAESLTDSTTTTDDYSAVKISHTTPSLPAGDYRIQANWEMKTSDRNNSVFARLTEDTVVITSSEREWDPVAEDANKNNFHSFQFKTIRTLSGVTVFELEFKNESSGKTHTISNSSFEIWRLT